MGILTDKKNREIQANSSAISPSNYIVSLGIGDDAKDYRVIDGDTIIEVGNPDARRLRLQRRMAPETLHGEGYEDGAPTRLAYEEVGGEHEKDVLFSVLSEGDFNTIIDKGKQTYGRGKGDRDVIELKNSKTGQDLNEYLLGAGLVNTNKLSTQLEVDAYYAGMLRRQLGSEDKYAELRAQRDYNRNGFKETALNSKWYVDGGGNDVYSGIGFRKLNETKEGYSTTPIATAFSTGYYSLLADLGGSLNAVGVLTGNEWLSEKGQFGAFVNNHRAANNPFQKLSRLSQIGADNDGFISATGDAFRWLGVNATQSAPFLLALAGSSVLTGGAAGVVGLSAGTAAAAATVVSTGTSAAFHTGEIWNNLDADKRTGKNAGIALALGTFAGALDRIALGQLSSIGKAFSPTALMSKEGRDRVIKYISEKKGVSLEEAGTILKTGVKKETDAFLQDAYQTTKGLIGKQRVIQAAILSALPAMGTEGATEVFQELTTFATAQAINEGVSGVDELYAFVVEELFGESDELRDILLNAGVAGGVIGGGFSAVSSVNQLANTSKLLANLDQSSSAELAPIGKVFYDNGNIDLSIDQGLASYAHRNLAGAGKAEAFDGGKVKGLNDRLIDAAETSTAGKRIADGESTYLGEGVNALRSLYKEELLRAFPVKALEASQALRYWYADISGVRGTRGGQSFEKKNASEIGTLKAITSSRLIGKRHNFDYKSEKQQDIFGYKLYMFGKLTHNKRPSRLTPKELEAIGITKEEVPLFKATAKEATTRAKLELNSRSDQLGQTYGIGSKEQIEGSKELSGYWWKHRDFAKAKITSNPQLFQKIVADAVRKVSKKGLSAADKKLYRNPDEFAARFTEGFLSGRAVEGIIEEEYSLINAGSKSPHKRTLDLSNQPGMEQFLDNNFFRTMHAADQQSVRNSTRLKYLGHEGEVMDMRANDAAQELKAAGYKDHEIVSMLSQGALATKGILDASESNYKPIENETARKMQDYALLYTGVIGMSLSAPASIPEFLAILIGLRKRPDFNEHAIDVGNKVFEGVKKTLKNMKAKALGTARYEEVFNEVMEISGVPNDAGYFQRKFGAGDDLSVGPRIQRANQTFYWVVGLEGITDLQRTMAASTAVDLIRDETSVLIPAIKRLGNREVYDKPKPGDLSGKGRLRKKAVEMGVLNSNEIQAYTKLQELGIDVQPFIAKVIKAGGADQIEKTFTNVHASLLPDIRIGILAFVDSRIQNPGAANRPLILQDPHYRMLTQFNGFISTATTTLLGKIWNDNFGRGLRTKHPTLSFDTFSVVVGMILLGGLGQAIKDLIKFGEDTKYLTGYDKYAQRALVSSGVLGQGEKLLEVVKPLYESEGLGERIVGTFTGTAGRSAESVADLFIPHEYEGVTAEAETLNDVLRFIPGFSNLTGLREGTVNLLTK